MFRDPGSFWHVAAGEKMLAAGQVIREDPFSFTRAGHPWVADQWLAECGMAVVHRLAGWDGLLLLTATLLAGVYAWIGARLLRGGLHVLPTVLLLALAMLAGSPQFHVRPLIVTIVLLGVTFGMVGRCRERQPAFAATVVARSAVHSVDEHARRRVGRPGNRGFLHRRMVRFRRLAACAEARGDRPAGVAASRSPSHERARRPRSESSNRRPAVRLGRDDPVEPLWLGDAAGMAGHAGHAACRSFIEEHAPLDLAEPIGWGTLALAAGYLATLIGVLPRRPRITWLVPLVWFVLALSRVRNAPLFGVTAVIALADMLPHSRVGRWLAAARPAGAACPRYQCATAWNKQWPSLATVRASTPLTRRGASAADRPLLRSRLFLPAIVVAAAMLLQVGGVRLPVIGRGWARFDPARWPVELLPALDKINGSSPEGTRIFNDLNFGGFLIYHAPRLRVFVDDRCPLYGTEFLLAYDRARRKDPAQIDRWRRQYGFR